jgi:hypothetical protein
VIDAYRVGPWTIAVVEDPDAPGITVENTASKSFVSIGTDALPFVILASLKALGDRPLPPELVRALERGGQTD